MGIFEKHKLIEIAKFPTLNSSSKEFLQVFEQYKPELIVYMNVAEIKSDIQQLLDSLPIAIQFTHQIVLPFKINYNPTDSIGIDRLAAVLGAVKTLPAKDLLVIQIGSCITYDIYSIKDGLTGGLISPGIDIRNRGMNAFTHLLPLVDTLKTENLNLPGNNTHEAIRSGLFFGTFFEIDGLIQYFHSENNSLTTIITGGNMNFFVERIKKPIFANPNLTLIGLEEISRLYVE